MKKLFMACIVALVPVEAAALVRYMVQDMTCADVQDSVGRDGVAILYRKSGSAGVPIYDRYVANVSFCLPGQIVIRESIPAADTQSCPVSKCLDANRFGGGDR